MELEFLKKLVDRYGSTSLEDIYKVAADLDLNNPAVLLGTSLIAISLAGIGLYMLIAVFSALFSKHNPAITESSIYHLNSRVSSLEMTISEYKNTIKHMSQQIAANKQSINSDLNSLRADLRSSIMEDLRTLEFRKVA